MPTRNWYFTTDSDGAPSVGNWFWLSYIFVSIYSYVKILRQIMVTSLCEFIGLIGAVIYVKDEWNIWIQWEGDIFLMEAFSNPWLGLPPKDSETL